MRLMGFFGGCRWPRHVPEFLAGVAIELLSAAANGRTGAVSRGGLLTYGALVLVGI